MCEYCGCQSIKAIEQLTLEHDRALDHARNLEAAARAQDSRVARQVGERLGALLAPHIAVEEQALFPLLADDFGEQIRNLQDEHELVGQALAELTGSDRPTLGWDIRLLHAMHVLRSHILKEQNGVFPAALTILEPQDWDRLDQVREDFAASAVTTDQARHR